VKVALIDAVRAQVRRVRSMYEEIRSTRTLLPPRRLHNVGDGDFAVVGQNYFDHFIRLGRLRASDRILDVGCGTGRIARPLTTFLDSGTYDGLDIVEDSVRWCQKAYRRHRNFRFHHADIRNDVYNPTGKYRASEYRFPFADRSFSFIGLTSVFTHMLPRDIENYFAQLARVVTADGRIFATFFLIDDEVLDLMAHGRAQLTFDYIGEGCRLNNRDVPEAAVGYRVDDVLTLSRRAGFRASVFPGAWSGHSNGTDWQDVVILTPS